MNPIESLPPEAQQAIQQIEQQARQAIQQAQQEAEQTVTLEKVVGLLRDQKMRPFVLEVETDSTIEPDQMAEKQNRVEFMTALGPMLQQGVQAMQMAPQLGKFVAESIRFVASGFKVPRSMDEAVDELAEGFANYQPPPQQGEDPQVAQAESQARMIEAQAKQTEAQAKADEVGAKVQEAQAKAQEAAQGLQIKQAETEMKGRETDKRIQHLDAQIQKIMAEIQIDGAKVALEAKKAEIDGAEKRERLALDGKKTEAETEEKRQRLALDGKKVETDATLSREQMKVKTDEAKAKTEKPRKVRTRVTKHDPKGRILEIEQEDAD